jgi:hypothetical protein
VVIRHGAEHLRDGGRERDEDPGIRLVTFPRNVVAVTERVAPQGGGVHAGETRPPLEEDKGLHLILDRSCKAALTDCWQNAVELVPREGLDLVATGRKRLQLRRRVRSD